MLTIHLPEVDSTNSYLLRQLSAGADYPDGTAVYTTVQSQGRGQQGNSWESEPGQNLAFSLLLKPTFLPVAMSFALSEVTTLAIAETLDSFTPGFTIKWPNDIYHDDRKAVGILIENRLAGRTCTHSIVGVGVNLNQREFRSSAPNPVSVAQLLGDDAPRIDVLRTLQDILRRLMADYHALQTAAQALPAGLSPQDYAARLAESTAYRDLHARYMARLYRGTGLHPYRDAETDELFAAAIEAVEPVGALLLRDAAGRRRRYMFKEVKFCLPCGVTKE